MKDFGCDHIPDTKDSFFSSIVQTIGIQMAEQYEISRLEKKNGKNHGKKPDSLSKDREDQQHYDMESEKRKIEAKGRRKGKNPYIILPRTEYEACIKHGEKYFLYLTINALTTPTLLVIPVPKLIEKAPNMEIKFNFPVLEDKKNLLCMVYNHDLFMKTCELLILKFSWVDSFFSFFSLIEIAEILYSKKENE
jgi:hypothetical protein